MSRLESAGAFVTRLERQSKDPVAFSSFVIAALKTLSDKVASGDNSVFLGLPEELKAQIVGSAQELQEALKVRYEEAQE
jgi:hypothetical protein